MYPMPHRGTLLCNPKAMVYMQVIENSGFAKMKEMAKGTRFTCFSIVSSLTLSVRNENFFRKGQVGDSRNHFVDPELVREFDALYAHNMAGVDDPYSAA